MSRLWAAAVALAAGMVIMPAPAATWSYNFTWAAGDHAGQLAGTCTYIVPDIRPLQVPRTLVVDSAAPVGTVLYSWDFNSFLPGFRVQCTGSGIDNSTPNVFAANQTTGITTIRLIILSLWIQGLTNANNFSTSTPVYATTLPGIGLRLYIKADSDSLVDANSNTYQYTQIVNAGTQSSIFAPPRDVVYPWGGTGRPTFDARISMESNGDTRDSIPNSFQGVSVKAELVKTADTVQYGNLGLAGNPVTLFNTESTAMVPGIPTDFLAGNAITVVSPSCRLRTTDYSISMGTWAADTVNHTGSPATGAAVPVGLDLECSGQVADVQFRFEDTGSVPSALAEKNVTLYDGGGNKVSGLEIQMKYNGNRVNVDGVTQTSTGSHGQVRTDAESVPLYTSTSQAMFTANYIQNGSITVGGNNYTGPVSGKVNIWVTYN